MLNNPKAWWTLLFIQCTMVALVLGAYFGMKTNILTMKNEVALMNVRVRALEERVPNSPTPSAQPSSMNAGANPTPAAPGTTTPDSEGSAPDAAPLGSSRQSPVCVNKMTHAIISCDLASKCLGGNNFAGDYFKKIRQKLGLSDSDVMMICDERATDEAAPAPLPHGAHSKNEPPVVTDDSNVVRDTKPPRTTASAEYGL